MKRFTDTDKWRDSWFRALSPDYKLAMLYIYDNCDAAGVFDPDLGLADFIIGKPVDWVGMLTAAGDRIAVLKGGKWHLTRFIEFQYGALSDDCKPHLNVIRLLNSHGIERVSKGYSKGQGKGKGKGKGNDKEKDKDQTEEIYAAYPRRVGKQDALKAINAALATYPADKLLAATKAYAEATALWPDKDQKFIPHPATWFKRGSYEDDPQTWKRGGTAALDPEFNKF
jgi:hypothetical protein